MIHPNRVTMRANAHLARTIMQPLDLTQLKVFPLAERRSLTRVEEILVEPDSNPLEAPAAVRAAVRQCARSVAAASGNTDRKSTRLNSSHQIISYAVFCLKKKK